GDEHDGVGRAVEQRSDAGIVVDRAALATRHAEGGEACLERRALGEELRVERIGAGIATLDVIDPQLVEHRRDLALVLEREVDADGLRAVSQRRVEKRKPRFRHCGRPAAAASRGSTSILSRDLVMRVRPSHSPLISTVLRLCAVKPRLAKKSRAASDASTPSVIVPRAAASFSNASSSMAPTPWRAKSPCT